VHNSKAMMGTVGNLTRSLLAAMIQKVEKRTLPVCKQSQDESLREFKTSHLNERHRGSRTAGAKLQGGGVAHLILAGPLCRQPTFVELAAVRIQC